MVNLIDKVAMVVGGAGYLGLPICKKLVQQGASVIVADYNKATLHQAVEEISMFQPKSKVIGLAMDIGDEKSIISTFEDIADQFGSLDILINAACSSAGKSIEHLTSHDFDAALHSNVTGSFMLCRESSKLMKNGGAIVLFGSIYALLSPDPRVYMLPMPPNPIEYGAVKAAILQMVRYLAVSWASRNIRVNAVVPGCFPNKKVQKDNPNFVERLAKKIPMGRIGQRSEVAGIVTFLVSDEASYITGQAILVDGGFTAW